MQEETSAIFANSLVMIVKQSSQNPLLKEQKTRVCEKEDFIE